MKRRIYLASSWRNEHQPSVLACLRAAGHEVYDFRNPWEGIEKTGGRGVGTGFQWSEIDPNWQNWHRADYLAALRTSIATEGFASDWDAMEWAAIGVLLLPSGRSAHLEAGYFVGANKPLHILLLERQEPELMYRMADSICLSEVELLGELRSEVAASR